MSESTTTGPDLTLGIGVDRIPEGGQLLGHVAGEPVLLVRPEGSDEVFAVGATCTHYGGPLAEGLVADGRIRCPWHHACFDLRTGEATAAPALDPIPCWRTERRGAEVVVVERVAPGRPARRTAAPESIVIVGAGAAGVAAADMLRREGHAGEVTLIDAEDSVAVDRPNLSKDFLAGTAPEDWVWTRPKDYFARRRIEVVRATRVVALHPGANTVVLSDGTHRRYGALLLATGADPMRLDTPGSALPHVHTLRALADSRAILERATPGTRVAVVGASFLGLEVAAALRTRGAEVRVIAPEPLPFARLLGEDVGRFVQRLHERHGVHFRLGHVVSSIHTDHVLLDDGTRVEADLVVLAIGVRPAVALAERAGLRVDRGVLVDAYLETSAPGVYAAGDIARWPDTRAGTSIRVEHWAVAQRQGQTAARNMLGHREVFDAVPFFWSQHYDVTISYVGHAPRWDLLEIAGSVANRDCLIAYRAGGRIAAVASIGRDRDSLRAEILLERGDQEGLRRLLTAAR